jgi:hypothetical protein
MSVVTTFYTYPQLTPTSLTFTQLKIDRRPGRQILGQLSGPAG